MSGVTDNPVSNLPEPLDPRAVLESSFEDDDEWTESELVQIKILERQALHVRNLEIELAESGYVSKGSRGQLRVSPVVMELRQQLAAMSRTAAGIRLPGQEPAKSRPHQKAAEKRWRGDAS